MCEEVRQPATQVPNAMVLTVILNTVAGLMFMIPLVFVLPNIAELVAIPSGQPVPTIIKSAVGSSAGAFALLVPLLVLGIICGIGCTTAASRATWAFARDGAIPGSQWWRQVNYKLDIPFNAMMLSSKYSRSYLPPVQVLPNRERTLLISPELYRATIKM
jgi:amino acid transporter